MAIPKVCGIENEFSFFARDEQLKPVSGEQQRELLHRFVRNFLKHKNAISYDKGKESRRKSVAKEGDDKSPLKKTEHDALADTVSSDLDGFILNGARFYVDVDHPEYSTPECLDPLDLVSHDKASELILMDAIQLFLNQLAGNRNSLIIHKNNSDGYGNSYGSHLNMLLSRKLVHTREDLRYLVKRYMPFQIARMILTGGGKLGSENGRPSCKFQISQRADFFETLIGPDTTEHRPIFNTRDEPHADWSKYFRLHDISSDALMCEGADFLRIALTQVVLAMIEDGFLEDDLFPKNPVEAMAVVSRDLKFKNHVELDSGEKMTGLEILRSYLLKGKTYLSEHPMTSQHVQAVELAFRLLEMLEKDPASTFGYLDWTTSLKIAESRPDFARENLLQFREISSSGFYYHLLKLGKIKRFVSDDMIMSAKFNPAVNTRAFIRAMLMKKFGNKISEVNWSLAKIQLSDSTRLFLELNNPALDQSESVMLQSILGI